VDVEVEDTVDWAGENCTMVSVEVRDSFGKCPSSILVCDVLMRLYPATVWLLYHSFIPVGLHVYLIVQVMDGKETNSTLPLRK
jgi:hypothetical protein